jgi:CheY-like chemotaxis protein
VRSILEPGGPLRENKPILLVEDDVVDRMTVERALKEIHVVNPLQVVGNGEEALEFLRDEANETPGIILLDLNMPKMNGIEFLKVAKADEALKRIPVIVLTTSKDEQDRVSTFDLGVAGYMIKPVDYQPLLDALRAARLEVGAA